MDLYGPLVSYWCGRCGLDSERAADCLQEVFLAVCRSIEAFECRRQDGSFRAWLWTITANKARDISRRESRHQPLGGSTALQSLREIPAEVDIPDDEPTDAVERARLMRRGIEQIRSEFAERSWQIFERSVVDNVPSAVVAKEFSVTPASVRQTRSRILRRLRQQLGDE